MKTTTSLVLAAVGAILAFAVTAHLHWISVQLTGWVLMLTGLLGGVLPRRKQGWLRRRTVLRAGSGHTTAIGRRRRYSRLLLPAGVLADAPMPLPTKSEVIEEYLAE